MKSIQIRGAYYTTEELNSFITKNVINEVKSYKLDPNCSADLWVSDPYIELTEQEKIAFIYVINYNESLNSYNESVKKEYIYYQVTDAETMMNTPHTFETIEMARELIKSKNWNRKVTIEKVTRIIETVESL